MLLSCNNQQTVTVRSTRNIQLLDIFLVEFQCIQVRVEFEDAEDKILCLQRKLVELKRWRCSSISLRTFEYFLLMNKYFWTKKCFSEQLPHLLEISQGFVLLILQEFEDILQFKHGALWYATISNRKKNQNKCFCGIKTAFAINHFWVYIYRKKKLWKKFLV